MHTHARTSQRVREVIRHISCWFVWFVYSCRKIECGDDESVVCIQTRKLIREITPKTKECRMLYGQENETGKRKSFDSWYMFVCAFVCFRCLFENQAFLFVEEEKWSFDNTRIHSILTLKIISDDHILYLTFHFEIDSSRWPINMVRIKWFYGNTIVSHLETNRTYFIWMGCDNITITNKLKRTNYFYFKSINLNLSRFIIIVRSICLVFAMSPEFKSHSHDVHIAC